MSSSGGGGVLQPPASPRGSSNSGSSIGPPPLSPKFSPAKHQSLSRPPISPGGRSLGGVSSGGIGGTNVRLQMPPLRAAAGNSGELTLPSCNIRKSEVLNRAHRRVREQPVSRNKNGGAGPESSVRAGSDDECDSVSVSSGAPLTMTPSPSQPLTPYLNSRVRSVSYDEADTTGTKAADMPQDELNAIRMELRHRREKKALLDQRRLELEQMMSGSSSERQTRQGLTERMSTTTASADEERGGLESLSPLQVKACDSSCTNKTAGRQYIEQTLGFDEDASPPCGNKQHHHSNVVSPASSCTSTTSALGETSPSVESSVGGNSRSRRTTRGRSLTPRRDRSINRPRGTGGDGSTRRLMSHSPAPQNMGVRRLGRAVDAVLARRKRRGTLSAGGGSALNELDCGADSLESHRLSLTDEEKHVLAKIIVCVDARLERELESAKDIDGSNNLKESNLANEVQRAKSSQKEVDCRVEKLEKEHEMSIRAIHRTLADVTTEKNNKIEELQKKLEMLTVKNVSSCKKHDDTTADYVADVFVGSDSHDADLRKRDDTICHLERRLDSLTKEKEIAEKEMVAARTIASASLSSKQLEIARYEETIQELKVAPMASTKEITSSTAAISADASALVIKQEDFAKLKAENERVKKDLAEKKSLLETAKMMITSLESASGSQANDLRTKLKERNVELANLKVQVENSGAELSALKSELLHLQSKYVETDKGARETRAMLKKQRSVHQALKKEISKISNQSSVVRDHPVEVEVTIGGEVSSLVQKSLVILAEVDKLSTASDEAESQSEEINSLRKTAQRAQEEKDAAVVRLNEELVNQNVIMTNMEDQLKLQKVERDHLQSELESQRRHFQQSLAECQFEIQRLMDDLTFSNEQLLIKEKELNLLKESLNEPSTGYISDDDDFDEEDGNKVGAVDSNCLIPDAISVEAENLHRLLAAKQGSLGAPVASAAFVTTNSEKHVQELEDAKKEIEEKEEALANAKMIISSLEMSNKSMLDDLRNRLHDSNTAIITLLSKNQDLESKMKALTQIKEEETKKLKEEALDSADRLALLRQQVDKYSKTGVDDSSSCAVSSLNTSSSSSYLDDMTTTDEEAGRFAALPPDRKPDDSEEEV